jgi:hypothetical protein
MARNALLTLALVTSTALFAGGCAADAEQQEEAGTAEAELGARIPLGTYVHRFGPNGSMGEPLASQRHVTRLTVKANNAFEADVLVETAETRPNPFNPWFTYRSVSKDTVVRRGTMKFETDAQGATVSFGDVGTFRYKIDGKDLTLTSTAYRNERRTELRLDASYQPAQTTPRSFHCVHRYVDEGDSVDVTLDEDNGQGGKAVIKNVSGPNEWPASGTYKLTGQEAYNGWRGYEGKTGQKRVELRFPLAGLSARSGSFDGGGSYYVGDALLGGDFNLSLKCTHN